MISLRTIWFLLLTLVLIPSCSQPDKAKQDARKTLKALKKIEASDKVYKKQNIKLVSPMEGKSRKDYESYAENYMITTQGKYSTAAGVRMFQLGGNAFDAAAAVSFTISVERPQSTGIGGGGFMLIDRPEFKIPISLDFREKAPLKSTSDMYLKADGTVDPEKSLNGIFSAGVPGLVKGVLEMHKRYGTLPLQSIMKPAIELAEKGFLVYPELADALKRREDVLRRYKASRKIFFKNNRPLKTGEWLVQKDLGRTLRAIQKNGENGFYKGWVAKAIVKEFKRLNGLLTQKDLDKYNTKWRRPVSTKYRGFDIYSMGPPSSGGTHIVQILNILEPLELREFGAQNPKSIHLTAQAMQFAFVDRARYLGDSDFVIVPVKGLTSKEYAWSIRKKMGMKAVKPTEKGLLDAFKYESPETTHFTIADRNGNIVTSTQTINYSMGSGVVVPGTGIVLNDEMDDFSKAPGDTNVYGAVGSTQNLVAPEKRPLSSMSPTIVKDGKYPILALGTPSGTRILTCVTQVILNYIEHQLPLYDAVAAVRYHHQWRPEKIFIEEPGFSREIENDLIARGNDLERKDLRCRIQAVSFEGGKLHGVSDMRGEGKAVGN